MSEINTLVTGRSGLRRRRADRDPWVNLEASGTVVRPEDPEARKQQQRARMNWTVTLASYRTAVSFTVKLRRAACEHVPGRGRFRKPH